MKKRWISLFVENDIGVLARIAGLFSGKSYNLDSLTVGVTEDKTVSRMTIGLTGDDITFEQIKKQLNRCVEVIKVIDLTDVPIHLKEIMLIRINYYNKEEISEIFRMVHVWKAAVIDYSPDAVLIESVRTSVQNDKLESIFSQYFPNRTHIIRGGSVAAKSLNP